MMKRFVGVSCTVLAFATPAAGAEQTAPASIIEVQDVDRDTVPAGTPEAFWAAFGENLKNEADRTVDETTYTYVPLALIPLPGGKTALVSTGASECTGHACSGLNSVHYLERKGARYTVTGEWLDVGTSGTFGNPALYWGWSEAIAAAPVLYTEGGGTWQGYSCAFAVLTELAATGPAEIASIPIYYTDEGARETNSTVVKGQITAAEKGRSFTVTYTGTRTFSERYVRGADGTYKVAGKSRVPTC